MWVDVRILHKELIVGKDLQIELKVRYEFAENEDYISFVIQEERHNPKPKTDYKLTSDFAKELSVVESNKMILGYYGCSFGGIILS